MIGGLLPHLPQFVLMLARPFYHEPHCPRADPTRKDREVVNAHQHLLPGV